MPLPPRTPFRSGAPVFPEPFRRAMLAHWEGLVGDLAQAGHTFHEAAQALTPESRGGEVPQPWEP
jgi:hypothetical protein